MNAATFYSQETFNQLRLDVLAKKEISSTSNQYSKKCVTNGNTYKLCIHAGHFNFGNHDYFVSLWYDYNYPGLHQSRNIGGGSYGNIHIESYEAFKTGINELLRRFPDYKEEAFEPVQLSLF